MSGSDLGNGKPDALIRALAARQHGLVARVQLVQVGIPPHRIDYRLRSGGLVPLSRGVYRVGPIAAPREREMAAVLACGVGAVLSHRSAAVVWNLVPSSAAGTPMDVSIRSGCRAPAAGVRVHRLRSLDQDEITRVDGVPVTTPARTLLDLASCIGPRELERAIAHALRRRPSEREDLIRIVARHRPRRGTRQLCALLDRPGGPVLTRSEAEDRFLALIRRARLGKPEANVIVGGFEVDFLWRKERLVAEIDGFAYHSTKDAFERDRRRDVTLTAAGLRVIRVTWRQIVDEPEALLVRVAEALARTGGTGGVRAESGIA